MILKMGCLGSCLSMKRTSITAVYSCDNAVEVANVALSLIPTNEPHFESITVFESGANSPH